MGLPKQERTWKLMVNPACLMIVLVLLPFIYDQLIHELADPFFTNQSFMECNWIRQPYSWHHHFTYIHVFILSLMMHNTCITLNYRFNNWGYPTDQSLRMVISQKGLPSGARGHPLTVSRLARIGLTGEWWVKKKGMPQNLGYRPWKLLSFREFQEFLPYRHGIWSVCLALVFMQTRRPSSALSPGDRNPCQWLLAKPMWVNFLQVLGRSTIDFGGGCWMAQQQTWGDLTLGMVKIFDVLPGSGT